MRLKRSKSVLYLPIVKQAKLAAALFLENNLTPFAFTPDRVYGPAGAAARLGIPRTTQESKIKVLKINKNRFRGPDPSKESYPRCRSLRVSDALSPAPHPSIDEVVKMARSAI